jgi:HPt (histidine-containing phosphotransfer) domain-containing protein
MSAAGSAAVDVAAALRRMGGRRAVYGRLLASFVDGLPRLPAALRDAFSGAGTGPVAGILHNLKGLAGTLGARSLAEAVAREERSLRTADSSGDVAAAIERACAALDAAAPGLRALHAAWSDESVEQPPAAPCGPSGPAVLRRDLEALHAQLRDQDMAAVDSMERLRAHGDALPAPVLQGLDEAVAALDFVRAEALCRALLDTTGASLPLPA